MATPAPPRRVRRAAPAGGRRVRCAVVVAVVVIVGAPACSDGVRPAPAPSPAAGSPTSPAPSPTAAPTPAALPTFGQRVLAAAEGTGTKFLPGVSGARGLQVLVSCVGTSLEVRIPGVFSATHECGDGAAMAYEVGPRAGELAVTIGAPTTTSWRAAVVPGT